MIRKITKYCNTINLKFIKMYKKFFGNFFRLNFRTVVGLARPIESLEIIIIQKLFKSFSTILQIM